MEQLGNQALDCTHFLVTDQGIFIISEKKGSIALAAPTIIRLDLDTYRQSIMATLASGFGLEIKMRPIPRNTERV